MDGFLFVPDGGRVPPGDIAVGPDEQRAGFLDFTCPMPVVIGVFAALSTDDHGAQVRQLEFAGGFIPTLPGSDQYLDELR